MYRTTILTLVVASAFLAGHAAGQPCCSSVADAWLTRVSHTQAEQPHWITPLVTVTPRLEQELRSDLVWQDQLHDRSTTLYGNGKGLELIPTEHTEVIFGIPAYIEHHRAGKPDGLGDVSFLLKYRLLSANEQQGNYILTAFLGASVPTGTHGNSVDHDIFTPTLALGKGVGAFDLQSTLGVSVPDGGIDSLGTPVQWNTALQYVVHGAIWPEAEVNLTSWPNGDKGGETQVFLTPGVVVGRFPIWQRLGVTLGIGVQLAVTSTRTANRNWILSARLPF